MTRPAPDPSPRKQPARRVAVVDNCADTADALAQLLRLLGMEVRVCYSGATALEVLRGFAPAVVFLDLSMPDLDGYEVARRLRQAPELANVVLVAVTGWGSPEDRRRSAAAGFAQHLVKPLDYDVLRALLASLPRQEAP